MIRWRELYREPELYKAAVRLYTKPLFNWRKSLSTSHDQRTLYDFAKDGLKNLDRFHKSLAEGSFRFRPGIAVRHNFNGKHRTLYIYPWEERLVDLLLYRLLNRRLNAWFAPQSYAYRINGLGVDLCQRRLARLIGHLPKPIYVVKRDISDFFASIDHSILRAKITSLVDPDDGLGRWLEARIAFQYFEGNRLETASRGVPFGTAIACCFANIYLTNLDRRLGVIQGLHFYRYADDLLALSCHRDAAEAAAAVIGDELAALNLESKPTHALNLALAEGRPDDGAFGSASRFRYLGLEFRADGSVGLSRDKSRKIRNLFRYEFRRRAGRLRQIKDIRKRAAFVVSLAAKVVNEGFRNVAIIDYYLRHVDDEEQLSLIDRWLAEEVVSLACGGGHRKGHFRALPFGALRRLGLPSLVHRRRLLRHGHLETSFFVWRNRNGVQPGSAAARAHAGATAPGARSSLRTQEQQSEETS